jgi:hypothetical protein
MSPEFKAAARHWIFGVIIACLGVAVSRLLAPGYEGRMRAGVALTGQLVALGGLLVILLGIRRRVRRASADDSPAVPL